jgi:hypothetical protein
VAREGEELQGKKGKAVGKGAGDFKERALK